ncbi:TPA: [formate-C-acetyltransferase]-activating enzyme, partial [Escherichia coli]
ESISGKIQTVRREAKCLHCAKCLLDADECPSGAFERIGRDISLDALEREVMKDDIFFRTSGGGVTLSGGEVLMQAEFATRFLQRLRLWGVSCAIETAGDAPASKLLPLAKLCDEVLFDLKIMDATQARDVVKMNLPRVLENLRLLVSEGVNVIPRLPLIPGFTLSRENMQQALDVLIPLKIRQIHLLPFHQYGEPKYRLLGKTWSMKEVPAPSSADVTTMREMAERAGFQVTVGG